MNDIKPPSLRHLLPAHQLPVFGAVIGVFAVLLVLTITLPAVPFIVTVLISCALFLLACLRIGSDGPPVSWLAPLGALLALASMMLTRLYSHPIASPAGNSLESWLVLLALAAGASIYMAPGFLAGSMLKVVFNPWAHALLIPIVVMTAVRPSPWKVLPPLWTLALVIVGYVSTWRPDKYRPNMGMEGAMQHWPCVELWNDYLRAELLEGFDLQEPLADVYDLRTKQKIVGWEAVVNCPPGSRGASEIRQNVERIATTMQVSPANIEVVTTENHARPVLRVIHNSVLRAGSAPWENTGVDVKTGTLDVGTYADGGRSQYQLWESNGQTWHGWLCGGTGSGKSSAMHGLLARGLATGQVVLDLVPIGGGSMYAWEDKAFRYGTTVDAATEALERGVAIMDARSDAASRIKWVDSRTGETRVGRDPLPPGREWPVYWIVIDEFPRMAGDKRGAAAFKRIAAEGRKWRVALLVASQGATVKDTWWNDSVVRENVRQGNVLVLRGSKGSASLALDGVEAASGITDIPPGTPGMGYLISKASSRAMLSRVDWIDDADDRPDTVPSSWEVASHAQVIQPNQVDLAAIRT